MRRINEGALLHAAYALEMWRKADFEGERIVLDALIRRRAAEKSLFLTPTDGFVPAPSPILPPKIDFDAASALPRQLPLNLVVPMEGDVAEAHQDETFHAAETPATATAQAADAVAARLQALLPETDESPSSPEALAPRTASPEADREEPAREAVDPVSAPASELVGETDVEPILPPPPETAAQDHPAPAVIYSPEDLVEAARVAPRGLKPKGRMRLLPYGPLFSLGLVLFIGGVAWQVMQKDPLGLGVALLGALLIAVSIYYLLQQIDEDQGL